MTNADLSQMLSDAIGMVLETMFFSAPQEVPNLEPSAAAVTGARVVFKGHPSGALLLSMSAAAARLLTANFLGEEEEMLTDLQIGQVVCELANMLCGTALSKMESSETFELAAPELVESGEVPTRAPLRSAAHQSFNLEKGTVAVSLSLEDAL